MNQHPIPQNVSAYEFHLIGNMTIKQFLELAAGVGVAVLFYALPFPGFIKWPMIVVSIGIGAAFAFLPFDGRPLDRMVIVFLRAVYSPTQYIWRKNPAPPSVFNYAPKPPKPINQRDLERRMARQNLGTFLQTLPSKQAPSDLDDLEKKFMASLTELYQSTPAASGVSAGAPQLPDTKPDETIRVRKMRPASQLSPHTYEHLSQTLHSTQISIPTNDPVAVINPTSEATSPIPTPPVAINQPTSKTDAEYQPPSSSQSIQGTNTLPIPKPPTSPNTLVGMVVSTDGKIIDNAIIQVVDTNGTPVKALKTNTLGQFFSAGKLDDGTYYLQVTSPTHQFPVFSVSLTGTIMAPLELRAQA